MKTSAFDLRIRPLEPDDVPAWAVTNYNAYPSFYPHLEPMHDELRRVLALPGRTAYGAFDGDTLVGSYLLYDFEMNVTGRLVSCGGIGLVAVALDRRKQGIARGLIQHGLQRMRETQTPVSMLYPFRTDFYQRLGWGSVVEVREHQFKPSSMPAFPEASAVRKARESDRAGIMACYATFLRTRPCVIHRTAADWTSFFGHQSRLFCVEGETGIEGYLSLAFHRDERYSERLANRLVVTESVYTTPHALRAIVGFLASLADQVTRIRWFAPRDERLELFLTDPSNDERDELWRLYRVAYRVGVGLMLRVVDVRQALVRRGSYNGVPLCIRWRIDDSQIPENAVPFTTTIAGDQVTFAGDPELEVSTDISTFSQLYGGALSLSEAIWAQKATCSEPDAVSRFDAAFRTARGPFCLTFF